MLFIGNAQRRDRVWKSAIDLGLAAIAAICLAYLFYAFAALISERMFGPSQVDVVVGVVTEMAEIFGGPIVVRRDLMEVPMRAP